MPERLASATRETVLVRAVLDAGHEVSTVPGPVALIAALVSSGLPTSRFVFEGFLPRSGPDRRTRLAQIAGEPRTIVLYEAPHRVVRTIADLTEACGPDRAVAVARELTKLYETVVRGTLGDIELGDPRGEYVIVLGGAPAVDCRGRRRRDRRGGRRRAGRRCLDTRCGCPSRRRRSVFPGDAPTTSPSPGPSPPDPTRVFPATRVLAARRCVRKHSVGLDGLQH